MNALVPYNPKALKFATTQVVVGERKLHVPAVGEPSLERNDINIAAYTLLLDQDTVLNLTPFEISFLGSCTKLNWITKKQRAVLKRLLKEHLAIDLDGKEQDEAA